MATITIHADDALLAKLEKIAEERHTSLEAVIQQNLNQLAEENSILSSYDRLMEELRPLGPLPRLSREERNAR
jgi:predicted transcriptional regulator